ncbi:hypothetical protein ACFQ0Q_29060 [Streptomyces aureus]
MPGITPEATATAPTATAAETPRSPARTGLATCFLRRCELLPGLPEDVYAAWGSPG